MRPHISIINYSVNMKCVICESPLQGNQRKYCSNKCKQKSHYTNSNGYDLQMRRGYIGKLYAIESLGGSCTICGYKNNISALEFHHIDEGEKEIALDIRAFSNNNLEKLKLEINKCTLLCANCHREHHNPESDMDKVKEFIIGGSHRKLNKQKKYYEQTIIPVCGYFQPIRKASKRRGS